MKKLATLVTLAFLATATPVIARNYVSLNIPITQQDTSHFKVSVNISELERKAKTSPSKKTKFDLEYAKFVTEFRFDLAHDLLIKNYGNPAPMSYDEELRDVYSNDLKNRRFAADRFYGDLLRDEKLFVSEFKNQEKKLKSLPDKEQLQKLRNFLIGAKNYLSQDNIDREAVFVDELLSEVDASLVDIKYSEYDIEKYFKKKTRFEKDFFELINKKNDFSEAEQLLIAMKDYATARGSNINFNNYLNMLHAKQSRFNTDTKDSLLETVVSNVMLRSDTLNPEGIFRVDNKIVVIVNEKVNSTSTSLINGALYLKAQKTLITYFKNHLSELGVRSMKEEVVFSEHIKFYTSENNMIDFLPVEHGVYQGRFLFDMAGNPSLTEKIRDGYLPSVDIDYGLVFEGLVENNKINYFDNALFNSLIIFRPHEKVILRDKDKDGVVDLIKIIRDDDILYEEINSSKKSDLFNSLQEEYTKTLEIINDSIK